MLKQDLIRLSQSHLNLLSVCPPKFQQVYLDGLSSLPEPTQQESMQWGSRFHLLMQQRELTLPIDSLLTTNAELDRSFKALIQAIPYLQEKDVDLWREAEHSRSISLGNFLLTVIYDLLVAQPDRALILDWKTHRQPQKRLRLAQNWQTRLYLYVLVETSEYSPEQIQMIYWFVKSGQPESVTFSYSQPEHQQTEQDLTCLLGELKTWLENYRQFGSKFPHQASCEDNCPFRQSVLANEPEGYSYQALSQSISEIDEIYI